MARRPGGAAGRPKCATVRTRADYEAWYPVFGASGLVVPTWPVDYGGLDVAAGRGAAHRRGAAPFNLGRLNPLGLNLAAPALFAHGTEEQRLRYLPPHRAQRGASGASCSASPAPAPTWPRWRPGPSATATSGSSPARRCGRRGPTCRPTPCCWPAPTPTCPSARASRTS